MKLWARHWVTFRSRRFGSLKKETPLVLLSIEEGSIGERDVPIESKPTFRHYMSNIFIYLMPKGKEPRGESVHGWELKLGLALPEAEDFTKNLLATIKQCKKRREERHKRNSNPGSPELENCINIRLTEKGNIEISFKDLPRCRAVKEEYRDILRAALVGGETIYKTLREQAKEAEEG